MTKQVFKNKQSKIWKISIRSLLAAMILSLVFTSVSFAEGGGRYQGKDAWSFGVHGDTQWTLEGNLEDNPEYVAAAMINALNDEFIANDVKFVIQVGDLTDRGTAAGYYSRADAAQKLYDKGIGFFPIRGNHETFESIYYPDYDNPPTEFSLDMNIPAYRDAFPQILGEYKNHSKKHGKKNFGAYNFSSPILTDADGNTILDFNEERPVLEGLSYSFDYGKAGKNARFVFVDTEATGYVRYIPTIHPDYGKPYNYVGMTVYNCFLGKPVYDTEKFNRALFKAVYAENGSMIENLYDIDGNELHSIWDVDRTLVASKYTNNIIRLLFDRDGNMASNYYDAYGNPIEKVYNEDGSDFTPTYDGESGWEAAVIYMDYGTDSPDLKEVPALYDCARNMITAVYDINHNPVDFYNSADTSVRTQLGIKDLELWVRISSGGGLSTKMYYEAIWPVTDWTILDIESWKTAGTEYFPGKQQTWIDAQLEETTRGTAHAFVFSHRPLINENHTDSFFGSSSAVTPDDQNDFYASLANNDVKFMISGHDHLYNRALDKSPDGASEVMQIITQGASTKFYTPTKLEDFGVDASPYTTKVKDRETQISQELKNFGYYIYTVDGPRVTVDYYSDAVGYFTDGTDYPDGTGSLEVPDFEFIKQEEWGYSLNGSQTLVAQGGSYVGIGGTFNGTTATILYGTNNSATKDQTPVNTKYITTYGEGGPRNLNKVVNTGWVANPDIDKFPGHNKKPKFHEKLKSHIISLWGMSELGAYGKTETYVLSMSFDFEKFNTIKNDEFGIATYVNNKWVNAVDENFEGEKRFLPVMPKWENVDDLDAYLGTYGYDKKSNTAWAVINYNADFAVARDIEPVPGHRK